MSLVRMFNISFIGMPGCGKSTLGNAISKELNLSFVDTDLLIEKKFEMTLEDVKNKFGYQFVRSSEEEVILSLDASTQIISTGGSAIYSDLSMKHLKSLIEELRIAAFCTGSGSIKDLAKAPMRRVNDWSVVEF